MPRGQVTLRVFSHRCWTVALIGQFVGALNHSLNHFADAAHPVTE